LHCEKNGLCGLPKMLRLSKRLEMIAQEVPEGSRLADIGSDHALLPAFLAERGRIVKAVAGEVNAGPFEAAAKQVRGMLLESIVDVRLGDGLEVIAPNEVDVITIAGMGGALISSILEAGKQKLAGVSKLILQPNVGEYNVRVWLAEHDWVLTGELILEEDLKIYEILSAVPSADTHLTNPQLYESRTLPGGIAVSGEEQLKFGPYLVQRPAQAWFAKWRHELDKLEKISGRLSRSVTEQSRSKQREIEAEITRIREVITCLQKDKP
jgi:tRNA (adenine22-N1)-methyltransferase